MIGGMHPVQALESTCSCSHMQRPASCSPSTLQCFSHRIILQNVMVFYTGTGGNPTLGEQAAEESAGTIGTAVGNADMVSSVY
jgi:hypothetical protein